MLLFPATSFAAEPVGRAVSIRTEVSGASGPLAVRDPVYRDERIRTSKSGLGQFVFQDGTKLAVGWGSSVVIDKFVYDGTKSVKKLTIMAAKGTFRWVSGKSKHSAYEIVTPAGTIGVRGTAFDFYVGRDGTTAVVLLNGAASFCGAGGCRQLTRRCDCVVATPGGGVSRAARVSQRTLRSLGNAQALPFLSGGQRLSGTIGAVGAGCGLQAAVREDIERPPARVTPQQAPIEREEPKPEKPRSEKPHAEKPHHEKPDRDKPDRDKPDRDKEHGHHDKDRDDDHGDHGQGGGGGNHDDQGSSGSDNDGRGGGNDNDNGGERADRDHGDGNNDRHGGRDRDRNDRDNDDD
ncbi:FecR domain-containing protein [Sinorhizobium sp. A49]|uniref:FecR family protein n=1 Tax=Sinorhizobium sp. A49 TaxID=1945861 RepID=UPI001FD87439|nr:FecR domain-containing protein [Sinorhizobium sp. A49]